MCQRHCIQMEVIEACGCFHMAMDLSLLDIEKIPYEERPPPCNATDENLAGT